MLSSLKRLWGALLVMALLTASASAQTVVVYSNSATGDMVVGPSSGHTTVAIGSSGWIYTNVRKDGSIGIRTDLPRNGNGSVWMRSTSSTGKADIEFFGALGTLGNLTTLKYDWYRKSSSTVNSWLHPVLRLYVDADGNLATSGDRGYLIFERAYNQGTSVAAPTDSWVTEDLMDPNYNGSGVGAQFWQRKFSPGTSYDTSGNWKPIQTWQSSSGFAPSPNGLRFDANSFVYGLSLGIGSGWAGTFEGAVDNLVIGFGGQNPYTVTYNFEVVPEPTTMALFGLGLAAVGGLVRRKKV